MKFRYQALLAGFYFMADRGQVLDSLVEGLSINSEYGEKFSAAQRGREFSTADLQSHKRLCLGLQFH